MKLDKNDREMKALAQRILLRPDVSEEWRKLCEMVLKRIARLEGEAP